MTEIRHNVVTGRRTISAPARSARPLAAHHGGPRLEPSPAYAEDCPFCPGNEDQLAPILYERSDAHGQPWQTRVVQNKYPALTSGSLEVTSSSGPFIAEAARGGHEVIVENPRHDADVPSMSLDDLSAVIATYLVRYRARTAEAGIENVIIFRNHGPGGGGSLPHPHSQLIASDFIPADVAAAEVSTRRYFTDIGRCALCDMAAAERQDGKRIVAENEGFVAFVPFAAEVPFETWIAPLRHEPDFGRLAPDEITPFATMLRTCLACLWKSLDDPGYNFAIVSATRENTAAPHLHWYLRVFPHITYRAGYEMATGMTINPSPPEADAERLRAALS